MSFTHNNKFDLQREFIRIFKEKTPPEINPVDLLTEIVPLKKEAAYRRLRGEQSFSLNEVAIIANQLKISLDDIIDNKPENSYTTSFIRMDPVNPFVAYYKTMKQIVEALEFIKIHPGSNILSASDSLPYSHLLKYPALSKFRLFKYIYQCRKETIPKKMAEIIIPDNIREIEKTFSEIIQQINTSLIWTKDIFTPYVTDILYFKEIGLLSDNELQILKGELQNILNDLMRDTLRGEMKSSASYIIYLSNTFFDTNYIYIECPHFKASSLNVFGINFYSSTDPELCENTKEWIDSLIKYAVLISKCGTMERITFFKRQQELLDTIN